MRMPLPPLLALVAPLALLLAAAPVGAQTPAPLSAPPVAPVTGDTHTVRMGGQGGGRFNPGELTIRAGDGVKFVMAAGGPHDVAFTSIPEGAKAQLMANMPNRVADLGSHLMLDEGEELVISFSKLPPGRYDYVCTPHYAAGMKGAIIVR